MCHGHSTLWVLCNLLAQQQKYREETKDKATHRIAEFSVLLSHYSTTLKWLTCMDLHIDYPPTPPKKRSFIGRVSCALPSC